MIPKLKILQFIVPVFLAVILITSPLMAQDLWPYQDETSGKWGYMNNDGEMVVECKYDYAAEFPDFDWIARVKLDNKYAYINNKGEVVTEWFDEVKMYLEGPELIKKDDKYNVINTEGRLIFKDWYDYILAGFLGSYSYDFHELVFHDNIWQIVKDNGKIHKTQYEDVFGWNYDWEMMAWQNGKWICLDANLDQLDKGFTDVYPFEDGLSLQYKFGKFGYINEKGEAVISFQFDDADFFSEGLAKVGKFDYSWNDQPYYIYGFINTRGDLVIDYQFSSSSDFKNGIAEVSKDGESYWIDKKGNRIVYPE